MSNLIGKEKRILEKFFEMGGGYVLDFSNRTFEEFFLENMKIAIYDTRHDGEGTSKANHLRAFWKLESNFLIGKSILALLDYWKDQNLLKMKSVSQEEQALADECKKIAERLQKDRLVDNLDAIQPNSNEKDFSLLVKSIKENISNNEPEITLDRLHTYLVKYIRQLCDKHGIAYEKNTAINGLLRQYLKYLTQNKIIESEMTHRILNSSISNFESFNTVRNEKSFAHDNPLLNRSESILIINNVANTIEFIQSIEDDYEKKKKLAVANQNLEDIPF